QHQNLGGLSHQQGLRTRPDGCSCSISSINFGVDLSAATYTCATCTCGSSSFICCAVQTAVPSFITTAAAAATPSCNASLQRWPCRRAIITPAATASPA